MKYPFIALMTDFGEDDFFAASLKGVIVKINPLARVIDITHRIPSFDIEAGSFILYSCYKFFPAGTIFLAVVDPGVGSARRILLTVTKDYYFISPDNGILSLVLERNIKQIREVSNKKYFLPELSQTFEGRDKMAPVAAWLSKGIPLVEFGPKVNLYKKIKMQKPQIKKNEIIGKVLYTDKFGNLITDIPGEMVESLRKKTSKEKLFLSTRGGETSSFMQSYSSAKKGKLLFLVGSVGLIEIAAKEASAKEILKIIKGDEVRITVIK